MQSRDKNQPKRKRKDLPDPPPLVNRKTGFLVFAPGWTRFRWPGQTVSIATRSPKSYATAVILSAVFGVLGVQHFYLGRWFTGLVDVALTLAFLIALGTGYPLAGLLFLLMDLVHTLVTTILLLTGSFRDGKGRVVTYPGQILETP